jgi:hypothetical protein
MTEATLRTTGPILKALLVDNEEYSFSFSSLAFHDPFLDLAPAEDQEPRDSFTGIAVSDQAPVLCTSALRFIHTIALYLSLTKALTPMSIDIFAEVEHLIEFYVRTRQVYTVYTWFTSEGARHMIFAELGPGGSSEQLETQYSAYLFQRKFKTLKTSIVRIKDYLEAVRADQKLNLAPLKRQLNSTNASLYLLAERLIALDSCRHIWSVVAQCQDFLDTVLPADQKYVSSFLQRTKVGIEELDLLIAETQLPKLLRFELVVGQMSSIKWNDVSGECNNYVDQLLHVIHDLKQRLKTVGGGSLPRSLQGKVLRGAFAFTCEQLIEHFSKVKRLSEGGRRQMEVDLIAFRDAMAEVPDLPSLDGHLEYLQIWKESPDAILDFMMRRTDLPLSLRRLLLGTAPQAVSMSAAMRAQLIATVEEQTRTALEASD